MRGRPVVVATAALLTLPVVPAPMSAGPTGPTGPGARYGSVEDLDVVETRLVAEVRQPPGVITLAVRPRPLRVGRDTVRVSVRNQQGGTATELRVWVRGDGVRSRGKVQVGRLDLRQRTSVVVPVRVEPGRAHRTFTVWAAARNPDPLRSAESIRVSVLPRR